MTTAFTRRRLLAGAASIAAAGSLSACGGILPQAPPSNLYTLSPKTTFIEDLPRANWQLVVEEPYAAGGLDTHRIAIMTNPYEVKYYSEARWAERAPRMVQTLLIESFESTGKIVSVGRQSVGLRSDYNLQSELRSFEAELKAGSPVPQVRIKLNSKLIAQPRQQIVASASFERVVPARSADILAVVEAFDEALGGVLKETVQWTLLTARRKAE
jgi:cholesterol transport system auxiliary component